MGLNSKGARKTLISWMHKKCRLHTYLCVGNILSSTKRNATSLKTTVVAGTADVHGCKINYATNQSLASRTPPDNITPLLFLHLLTFVTPQITRQRQIDKDLKQTATEIKAAQADKQVTHVHLRAGMWLRRQTFHFVMCANVFWGVDIDPPPVADFFFLVLVPSEQRPVERK